MKKMIFFLVPLLISLHASETTIILIEDTRTLEVSTLSEQAPLFDRLKELNKSLLKKSADVGAYWLAGLAGGLTGGTIQTSLRNASISPKDPFMDAVRTLAGLTGGFFVFSNTGLLIDDIQHTTGLYDQEKSPTLMMMRLVAGLFGASVGYAVACTPTSLQV